MENPRDQLIRAERLGDARADAAIRYLEAADDRRLRVHAISAAIVCLLGIVEVLFWL